MAINYIQPQFQVLRNPDRCIRCRVCERQCANEVHSYDADENKMISDERNCVDCQRCVALCPTSALSITKNPNRLRENCNWSENYIYEAYKQADSGAVLLSAMGNPKEYPVYWDKILLNASQVTNPSIDPIREPMETRVAIGGRPEKLTFSKDGSLKTELPPQLKLKVPIMFGAMSYGAISLNAHKCLARAAEELGTYYNTGEGGLHEQLYKYGKNTIVQVASGRFGIHPGYLRAGAAIEIKMGQGAKPGLGGHLPGAKVGKEVSRTRMIPLGTDALSPYPHHDIYSIEDLRQLIFSLKEATRYEKPVFVKIAAVHNVAAIASGIARSGADAIVIDGFRGGTGAAPTRIRDNVGIPIELALAAVDREAARRRDTEQSKRHSFRLDTVLVRRRKGDSSWRGRGLYRYGGAASLGCHLCRDCHSGKCNWGIATQRPELVKRLNPEVGYHRLVNLVNAWNMEIKEMMGGMGINAIDSLRGNRLMLRGVGLNEKELSILGIKHAGE